MREAQKEKRQEDARKKLAKQTSATLRAAAGRFSLARGATDPARSASLRADAESLLQVVMAVDPKAWPWASLATAASCLSAYLLGGAAGIAVGGFLASRRAQDQIIALCISFGALISLLLASDVVAGWAVLPLMALMGFGIGISGPSRDLLVRKAATQGLGEASFGRVYGFVYSGLDIGLATAPLIFGPLMDGGHLTALWVGVALFQGLAVVSAWYVGLRVDHDRI